MSLNINTDTISAIATPPGKGGVGIIRISGPQAKAIGEQITRQTLKPRYAHYGPFFEFNKDVLDSGIALFFEGPNSFTGEDVVELQGHGGPVILDCLQKTVLACGARLANPGEFSERAFINDKIDLTQAEAIADLIESSSEQAARNAVRSLQGAFSKRIHELTESLMQLRIYVEAAIDFPEEEVDFLADSKVVDDLKNIKEKLACVFEEAKQGALLKEGMTVVIAGRPNAGKSSLLNALSGKESAIVTSIEGTTRDVLREHIQIDGLPLHIIDTAGLRESPDEIEREGIRRAWKEIENADQILLVVDSTQSTEIDPKKIWPDISDHLIEQNNITVIHNKSDLSGIENTTTQGVRPVITLSAKNSHSVDLLKQHLKSIIGYDTNIEGGFTARRRHLDAIERAQQHLNNGLLQLESIGAGELLAEDLRQSQNVLSEITGEFSSDDLLGKIFSSFCIGK